MRRAVLHCGDALDVLRGMPEASVHCCVTSPPYWGLRSYMPDAVQLRPDLTAEEREQILCELAELGIAPTAGGV